RLKDPASTLALVSDVTVGTRLSEILRFAEAADVTLDIDAALCLLRQLVPAVALLHENMPDIAHGAIAAERLVVTPGARLIVVEHVMGSALEQLRFSQERYWRELRIALPRSPGLPRFDHRADVTQLGVVALSLILGRRLHDEEGPARLGDLVSSAWAVSARGGLEPLPAGLRAWLMCALQLDARNSFTSAIDAQEELERVLGESDYLAAPATLESFLERYRAATDAAEAETVVSQAVFSAPVVVSPPVITRPVVSPVAAAPIELTPIAMPTPPPRAPSSTTTPAAVRKEPATIPVPLDIPQPRHETSKPKAHRKPWQFAAAAVVLIAVAGAGVTAARRYVTPSSAPNDGTLVMSTNPPGAKLFVDGVERGVTPLTVTIKAGVHALELRGDGPARLMPITMTAGAQVSQYIEMPKTASTAGQLQVRTEPAGAKVSVDGMPRGMSPVTVADLTPGEHAVMLESEHGSVKQIVAIEAGVTASLMVPLGAAADGGLVSGWIAVSAPADVQVFENKRLLGTSQSDRLMVSSGRHDIEIVNETLGYRAARTVQVSPGKVTPIKIEFPKGTIALNAVPWAEVWVDGEKVGDTPIGNLSLAIGSHEIVFRHPDLGEQRHAATVTVNSPARLSVDMRKK
ncbi:MAG TPA: PEGA domain-containing protein, partial [Vicinamibacterales bacterium]|nr:PEGA domain-containing protein [Vicinamibacterales bacterium]